MLKRVVFAAIIAGAVVLPAVSADANQIRLENATNRCAWVTLSWDSGLGKRNLYAGWLPARHNQVLGSGATAKNDVLAEMMPGGECKGKAVDHTPIYPTDVNPDHLKVIQNRGGSFQIVRWYH